MQNYVAPVMGEMNLVMAEDCIVWYVVAIIILVALAVTIVAACVLYCEIKGKHFTGSWSYTNSGGSIRLGCS